MLENRYLECGIEMVIRVSVSRLLRKLFSSVMFVDGVFKPLNCMVENVLNIENVNGKLSIKSEILLTPNNPAFL